MLLKKKYLQGLVRNFKIKFLWFSIFYKTLTISNYSFFICFKYLTTMTFSFRLYLLNINFYFLFLDYIYLINYISFYSKYSFAFVQLPIKVKSYSVLRSPFVYSKSREHFSINYYRFFFYLKPWRLSKFNVIFLDRLLWDIKLDNSKFWYKQLISL
jgi:hypothetical protein